MVMSWLFGNLISLTSWLLDLTEEMNFEEAIAEHGDLSSALDLYDQRKLNTDSKSMRTKKLAAQALLECIKLDHELGLNMVESWRSKWLDVAEHPNTNSFKTLEEYLNFRRLNVAIV